MHRLTATDTPMVRYTRTIFPSYAGNDDYYSGDANVNIKKGEKTLKYIYKGKVYINANNKSYIVLNEKGSSKFYVFNLGTKKKTRQMYYELLEHVH